MKELRLQLINAFVQSKAKKWQDVRVPRTFIDQAKQMGLNQEETFNYAINTWNKYVTNQLVYEPIRVEDKT